MGARERPRQALQLHHRVSRLEPRSFADAPYVLAIVELDEGPRMTTDIVAPPEQLKVGMPVTVFFDDVTPDHTLVKFKPA